MAHDTVYGICTNKCLVEVCPKSKLVTATIGTAWASNSTQIITIPEVKATDTIEITLPSSATREQVQAFYNLMLQDYGHSNGSITVKCCGSVNAINIPLNVIIRKDL